MLGDHNRWAKKAPYQASTVVPLCVRGPGIRPGVVNASPVSLIDLAASCLDGSASLPFLGDGGVFTRDVTFSPEAPSLLRLAMSGER